MESDVIVNVDDLDMSEAKEFRKTATVKATALPYEFEVKTFEGVMRGREGDYLCVGVAGDRWPIKREIFEATYKEVVQAKQGVGEDLKAKADQGTLCFDFDGVIHRYTSGWKGPDVIPDGPVEGIGELIDALTREGWRVVVNSARCASPAGRRAVDKKLEEWGVRVHDICEHKPPAEVYIDDRAMRFDGDVEHLRVAIARWIGPWMEWPERKASTEEADGKDYRAMWEELGKRVDHFIGIVDPKLRERTRGVYLGFRVRMRVIEGEADGRAPG